jgi:hypothetical protein
MDETKLRDQLDRLASEAVPPDPAGRRTLARARRRRTLAAGATSLIVLAAVVAGFAGIRSVLDEPVTVGQDPTPTTAPTDAIEGFPGLWPETDAEALAVAQASVDDGHSPLRTTAEGTATMFVTDLLGWFAQSVVVDAVETGSFGTLVRLRNPGLAPVVPPVEVTVRQLGETGSNGVWTVVAVTSPIVDAIQLDPGDGSAIHVSGQLALGYGQPTAVEALLLDGATADPGIGGRFEVSGRRFGFDLPVKPTQAGRATLLLRVPGEGGAPLGAVAIAVQTPVEEPDPAIHLEGAPPDVAVTAQRLLDGVRAHDVDALAELIDPDTFVYNFDDGSDPIPLWREDPSVLDAIPDVLRLPFVIREVEGDDFFYVWPYLMKDGALDEVSEQERSDLHALGFSDAEIEQMLELGGYLGPRLAIDADGVWRYYVAGGD